MLTPRRGTAALLVAASFVAGGLPAQQTWIVGPSGGHFTDLQTAINAASPGDTLLLRGGSHTGAFVDRSLHLVGDQPRPFVASLQLFSGTTTSVTGLDTSGVILTSCKASLEDVTATTARFVNTAAVLVRCTIDARTTTNSTTRLESGSRIVFDQCQLFGSPGSIIQTLSCTPIPGAPALQVLSGCTAELANSTLTGAGPRTFSCLQSPGTNGLRVEPGGTVRASHSSVASGGASVASVTGGGLVLHDSTQFSPSFGGGTSAFLPILTGSGAAPGNSMLATLRSQPALAAAMVASFGMRMPIAVPEGTAWIDPSAYAVVRIGLLDANGTMSFPLAVPPGVPRGLVITFQGVVAPGPSPALFASTPTTLHVL